MPRPDAFRDESCAMETSEGTLSTDVNTLHIPPTCDWILLPAKSCLSTLVHILNMTEISIVWRIAIIFQFYKLFQSIFRASLLILIFCLTFIFTFFTILILKLFQKITQSSVKFTLPLVTVSTAAIVFNFGVQMQ